MILLVRLFSSHRVKRPKNPQIISQNIKTPKIKTITDPSKHPLRNHQQLLQIKTLAINKIKWQSNLTIFNPKFKNAETYLTLQTYIRIKLRLLLSS